MFLLYVTANGLALYQCEQGKNTLKVDNAELKKKIAKLKVKVHACNLNTNAICHAGADYQSEIRYIDCGESFVERWATCLCTTMCLEDFTVVVTNRKRCRVWPSVPIQIRPEPSEEDEEDEEDEESN